jgi:hypothetical protein
LNATAVHATNVFYIAVRNVSFQVLLFIDDTHQDMLVNLHVEPQTNATSKEGAVVSFKWHVFIMTYSRIAYKVPGIAAPHIKAVARLGAYNTIYRL